MNYIALINQFWAKDLEHSFAPNDIAVYFRLLERSNALGWKNPFNFSVDELLVKLRLRTKDPLDTARNRLKQAGLIDFKNGDGRGRTTQYWLTDPDALPERGEERGKKNTPLSPALSPTLLPPLLPLEEPLLHKTKLNKTKKKEANASSAPPPKAFPLAEELTSPYQQEFQTWQHWARENAPRVLELKEPLTAAELHRLITEFGEPMLLEVFQAMHNYVPLLKNSFSANLTARNWCKRRAADPKAGSATAKARTSGTQAAKLERQTQNEYF